MKLKNLTYILLSFISGVLILYYGKTILLPFMLAIMIWFLIRVVKNLVQRIKIRKKASPPWLQNLVSFLLIFIVLVVVGKLLSHNVAQLSEVMPVYEKNILKVATDVEQQYGINLIKLGREYAGEMNVTMMFKPLLNAVSELAGNAFLVLIYVIFLMLEGAVFPHKLRALFAEQERQDQSRILISKLNDSINRYISIKTGTSFITGLLSYIALLMIGVDFAFFWAFLIFVLNYIPNIGSMVATLFPAFIALIQFMDVEYFFIVLGCIGAIQVVVGNFIEPHLMGSVLNISSLVVLLALAFWGSLWGVVGMILSVPVTVILIIFCAQFEQTRGIAILLSAKGKL